MTKSEQGGWNRWRVARWSAAAALLLTPLVAMQVSAEVQWTAGDFVFAAVMIGGAGLLYELAVKLSGSFAYRVGAALGLAACFLLIWINLAVGIIGNEDNPRNAVYFCEVLLAAAVSFAAGLKPAGMARAMLAVSGLQLLVTCVVFAAGWSADEAPGAIGLLALNGAFVMLWLVSAALFRRAAQVEAAAG